MAYTLANDLVSFTFDTDATSGLKLSSYQRVGSSQVWTNHDIYLWKATVYDTTTAPTTTTANLYPTAATFSATLIEDETGDELIATWTAVPVGSGDALTVELRLRVGVNEDWLGGTISSEWSGTPTKYTLDGIGHLSIQVDPLHQGQDFACFSDVFGILSEDPITNLRYSNGVVGFPNTGFGTLQHNTWQYPAGRGWNMAVWGYYETTTNEGWMLWAEDWSKEVFTATFESDGTYMVFEYAQKQPDNVLVGNNGRALGSGYKFCLRPFQVTQAHGWWDISDHYGARWAANPPSFDPGMRNERTDISALERDYSIFLDFQLTDTLHSPGNGEPGDLDALVTSVLANCGAPAGAPISGIVEATSYNIHLVGETADGDLQTKLAALYARGDVFLGMWTPTENEGVYPHMWSLGQWDVSVGDSAELRWWTDTVQSGGLRMDRSGYLAGGGVDRLALDTNAYKRERTYPVTSWVSGTKTLNVTGAPNADGFTGTLTAVIIPASGAARLGSATVSSLGASTVVVTANFLDSLGNTVTPAGGDSVAVFTATDKIADYCVYAQNHASAYLDQLINNTSVGIQASWGACGYFFDTGSEPLLQSQQTSRTHCYRDHSGWSKLDGGYTNHPLGGGDWYKNARADFETAFKERARSAQQIAGRTPFFWLSCEDIDETSMGRFDWCWHTVSAGKLWRSTDGFSEAIHKYRTIPMYAVVHHGKTMGRGLNQEFSSATLTASAPYDDAVLHAFLAYCLASEWPYGITWPTLSLIRINGVTLKDFWDDTQYVAGGGAISNTVKSIRDLWVQIVTAESNWLIAAGFRYGKFMAPAAVNLASTDTTTGLAQSTYANIYHTFHTLYYGAAFPRVTHGVWQNADGTILVVFANWTDTAARWSGVLDLEGYGLGAAGSSDARRIALKRFNYAGAESGTAQLDSVTGALTLASIPAFTVAAVTLTAGGRGMATIVKGITFSSTATAGGMHAMVEGATISGIERSAMQPSTVSVATLATTPPSSPADREVWHVSPSNGLADYDLANARWNGALPQIRRYKVAAGSADVVAGNALMAIGVTGLTELTLTLASGATTAKVVGIALHPASAGDTALCVIAGPAKAKCTGTVAFGTGVKLSATAGVVQSTGAVGTGQGWEVIGSALEGDSGGFVWLSLRR